MCLIPRLAYMSIRCSPLTCNFGVVAIHYVVWTSASAENDAAYRCLLDNGQKFCNNYGQEKDMLVSASYARDVYEISFPHADLSHPPWCYLYDVMQDTWVFIGAPRSPRGVMDVSW